jgi:hypothetical protein
MPFLNSRSRRLGAATLGVAVVGAGAALAAAFPAVAEGAVVAVTSVTCSVTGSNWCISGNNSSSGIGVIGTSKSGTGLRGTSTSQYGLKATSGSGTAILAQTTSGSSAITATGSSGGYGVLASGGTALYGDSSGNYGVYGTTSSGGGYGTVGIVSGGTGAYGSSNSGYGVFGSTSTGAAAEFQSGSGYGLISFTGGHVAVYAKNTNGNGSDIQGSYIGLLGRSPTSGFPLVLTDTNSNNLFYVDGDGNVSYKGGLFHFAVTRDGGTARSFSPNSTQPTVEDTGTAQLVGGAAVVRLDPTFAASIDPSTAYRVFVTPNGDTHGLFVATKTAAGFVVREAQAGRSTVSFDYRIVATALGGAGQRMARVSPAVASALAPHAVVPVVPSAQLPARLATPALEPAKP